MRLSVSGSVRSGNTPERYDVGYGIAADTVAAVHAARYFTGSVEALDGLSRLGLDFCLRVDRHAAHGVVNPRRNERRVVRSLIKRWEEGTKNGPDRSALLGHNFVYQETKPHGFYSSYFHQRISS